MITPNNNYRAEDCTWYMMPSPLHVCNGLTRPADTSTLAWDIGTGNWTK